MAQTPTIFCDIRIQRFNAFVMIIYWRAQAVYIIATCILNHNRSTNRKQQCVLCERVCGNRANTATYTVRCHVNYPAMMYIFYYKRLLLLVLIYAICLMSTQIMRYSSAQRNGMLFRFPLYASIRFICGRRERKIIQL